MAVTRMRFDPPIQFYAVPTDFYLNPEGICPRIYLTLEDLRNVTRFEKWLEGVCVQGPSRESLP